MTVVEFQVGIHKSVNLQYNTLVGLDAGTMDSSTKHLMFQVLFFFSQFLAKSFSFFFFSIYSFIFL